MKEYIVHLLPRSSIESRISSHTLFGVLCWAVRILYGEPRLEGILEEFNREPPFLISSAFPFKAVGKQRQYFLPRPQYPPLETQELMNCAEELSQTGPEPVRLYHSPKIHNVRIVEKYKQYQKIEWIHADTLSIIAAQGIRGERSLFKEYLQNRLRQPLWGREEGVQKNTLDRLTGSTSGSGNTFYNREIFPWKSFGLYFLLKTDDIDFVRPLLRFVEDSGIGANARTGKNHFQIEFEEKDVTSSTRGDSFVTLSRTVYDGNLDLNRSYYDLEFVRSKVESREEFFSQDIWKEAVTYFKEGSILTQAQLADNSGGNFPVKKVNGKTIYQYGFAYPFRGHFSKGRE